MLNSREIFTTNTCIDVLIELKIDFNDIILHNN